MARRWHRPSAFAVLLTLAGIAFFVALGVWQVDRAGQKKRLFAAFANAGSSAPVSLDEARRIASPMRFPLVETRGHYDTLHRYEQVDQTRDGKVGSIAYAIFEPAGGSTPILVDRGFVAGDVRGDPPKIPPPPAGEQQIRALYAPPPGSGLHLGGDALPRQTTWPKQSIYVDIGEIAADAGRTLDDRVLLLAPDPASGFVREWTPNVFPPERHTGYAMTWFTLAAVSAAMFVVMHWRKD